MSNDPARAGRREPHLSVVAVTRNDDHGVNMRGRMQHFVDGFIAQCRRHDLNAELILVEWNPPADRAPLNDALAWPAEFGPAQVRIITVPAEVHAQLAHSASLPLFQMIGKNVGIRRARGQFVLATNVDILFDDATIQYMRDRLQPKTLLRIDRYDVPSDLVSDAPFDQVLADCATRFFQVNTRYGLFDVGQRRLRGMSTGLEASIMSVVLGLRILGRPLRTPAGRRSEQFAGNCRLVAGILRGLAQHTMRSTMHYMRHVVPLRRLPSRAYYLVRRLAALGRRFLRLAGSAAMGLLRATGFLAPLPLAALRFQRSRWLHTNGCGDFTLMSRDDWFRLRGYAEWPIYSWHLDTLLMFAANANGIREIALDQHYKIYHINHSDGWSLDGEQRLFSRLRMMGIPFLENSELAQWQKRFSDNPESAIVNAENWGFYDCAFREREIQPGRTAAIMQGADNV